MKTNETYPRRRKILATAAAGALAVSALAACESTKTSHDTTIACPVFSDVSNNTLPHKTGADQATTYIANSMLGNFVDFCGNRTSNLDVVDNDDGGVTLRETLPTPGGATEEDLVLNNVHKANLNTIIEFSTSNEVTTATSNSGVTRETTSSIDASLSNDYWKVTTSSGQDVTNNTYLSEGSAADQNQVISEMHAMQEVLVRVVNN